MNAIILSLQVRNLLILIITLTEEIVINLKSPKSKVGDRGRINKYQNIFSKGSTENWQKEIFVIDSVLKTNPWTYAIEDLNEETIIGRFYEK